MILCVMRYTEVKSLDILSDNGAELVTVFDASLLFSAENEEKIE